MANANPESARKVGSVFDLPAKSFNIVKNNWQLFLIVNVLTILSALSSSFSDDSKTSTYSSGASFPGGFLSGGELAGFIGAGIVVVLVLIVVAIFLHAMSTSLEVRSSKGEKPNFQTVFDDAKKYWLRLFGLALLSGLMVVGGLILLIVPGLIILTRIIFASYHMVDKDLGILDSLSASNKMNKGRAADVWSALLLVIGIGILTSILGVIPVLGPLVGSLIMIAVSLILVLRYREIKNTSGADERT